ncbi:MAG: hypothetical protein SO125_07110 [Eubacteriales bacterium]|nr:hypothetical protein [Eubacteriales bacterium]MDY4898704.1 hypothetical protein [Eubacteriales bacterium]
MTSYCHTCGRPLHPDEEGLSIKLLGHNITEFFCIDCLAAKLGATPSQLSAMMERFRAAGCQLFTPAECLKGKKNADNS